jgi:outer membrane protein
MKLRIKPITILIFLLFFFNFSLCSQTGQDSVSISLQQAIEMALHESPTMRIANRIIQIKKHAKTEQIISLFPDVSLAGTYNRTIKKQVMTMRFGGQAMEIEVGTDNNYTGGINVSLPLIAPTLWQNLKLSQIDVSVALESARSSKISLVNEVKKAYYTVLLTQEALKVIKETYKNSEERHKIITDKYNQGLVSEFETLRSDVQLKNQRPQLTAAENAVTLSTMLLKVLLGVDIEEPLKFSGNLKDFEDNLKNVSIPERKALSLNENSSLKQLELSMKQMDISKKMIISAACPTLMLGGNYQYMAMNNDFKFSEYNWIPYSVINFSLRIPIVSWAGTAYKIKQSNLLISNLKDQKENLEQNLQVAIQNNINNIKKAVEDLASNKETMLQAEKAYHIAEKSYELGIATWLDLSSAELAMTAAKLTYYQSIYDYLSAYSELDAILGKDN